MTHSARKGHARLTSPIAIHASLHSTPLKKSLAAAAAAAGVGAPALTPLKLLPESAGKARVVALRGALLAAGIPVTFP